MQPCAIPDGNKHVLSFQRTIAFTKQFCRGCKTCYLSSLKRKNDEIRQNDKVRSSIDKPTGQSNDDHLWIELNYEKQFLDRRHRG